MDVQAGKLMDQSVGDDVGGDAAIDDGAAPEPPKPMLDHLVTPEDDQSEMFQHIDEAMRVLTEKPTPWEESRLRASGAAAYDIEKVIKSFGSSGAGRACKALLEQQAKDMALRIGNCVPVYCAPFTLCKHMHISSFKQVAPAAEGDQDQLVICHCLPRTSFQPMGCCSMHRTQPLWKIGHPYLTLGFPCSRCLRCGGYLT